MVDYNLDDEHLMLSASARDFLSARCPLSVAREMQGSELGFSPDLWREMVDLDWLRLGTPIEEGGAGGGLVELALIYIEMGRTLATSPHLHSAVIAKTILAGSGATAATELLPDVLSGGAIVIPIVQPLDPLYDTSVGIRAEMVSGQPRLNGSRLLVPYANAATHLLIGADTGDEGARSLYLVDPKSKGVTVTRLPNIADHALFAVALDDVIPTSDPISAAGQADVLIEPALARAYVLRSAEISGGGERLVELSVGYANDREQFGQPIGRFQAVQYLCTDIAIDSYLTRLYALNAAALADESEPFTLQAHQAKAYASRAARRMAHHAHEVFAGAAFMIESDVPLFSWMAKHWEYSLGGDLYHRRAVTRALVVSRRS